MILRYKKYIFNTLLIKKYYVQTQKNQVIRKGPNQNNNKNEDSMLVCFCRPPSIPLPTLVWFPIFFFFFFFNSFVIAILVIRKGPTVLLHEFDKKEVTGRFFWLLPVLVLFLGSNCQGSKNYPLHVSRTHSFSVPNIEVRWPIQQKRATGLLLSYAHIP